MDLKSQIDMFIDDTFTGIEDNDFDFNLDNIELEYVECNQHGITDFSLDGDPTIDEYDIVYIKRDTLESKLLEMLESASSKNPEMSTVYDAVNAVLKDTIIVAQGGFKPYVVDVEQVTREIVLNIVGEE